MTGIPRPERGRKMDLERLRCLRCGDLTRLYRHRWGALLPEDDSGRADLFELLSVTSLALKAPAEKMAHVIDTLAPWMPAEEAKNVTEHILITPIFERTRTARQLGDNMRLLNAEREALKLWTMLPVDMTDAQLAEQRKAKSRARRAAKRREDGIRTRKQYLAELASRPKPWKAKGVSRRTWFRRLARRDDPARKSVELGSDATILSKAVPHPVPTAQGEALKGLQRSEADMQTDVEAVMQVEDTGPCGSHGLGTHPVPRTSPAEDLRRVRDSRAGVLAAQWNNRHAPKEAL
jgi:hypothetical protein